jgi:hypothetical protein
MLLPAKQSRHGVNIWDVRRDNQRRHRKAGFSFQTHLPNKRANKAMCKIIHESTADGLGPEWQYGVIAMRNLFMQSDGERATGSPGSNSR